MLENPVKLLTRLDRAVRLLIAGTFINKLGSFIIPYLAIVLRHEFSLTATQVGALIMSYGVGSIVAILAGGFLTDRLGRRATLMLSLFGSGGLAVAMGFSPSIRVFVPLLVLFGFVADLYRPASSALISDILPSAQRVIGFAALRMAVNLGFAFGVALGGLLADWSWRLLFVGDGLTTVLFGLIVLFFIPETRPAAPDAPRGALAAPPAAEESPWRDGVFLETSFASLLFALVFFSHVTTLPLTITASAGYPARVFGFLLALNGALIALFEVSLVQWLKRYRRLRVAALGLALCGVGFALTGFVLHWGWFLITVLIWTAGEILCAPQLMAFVSDWAPAAARGRYLGLFQATWSVAFALNPLLFLPLHARMAEAAFWPLMLVFAAPASLLLVRLDRDADRPERLRGLSEVPPIESALFPTIAPEA